MSFSIQVNGTPVASTVYSALIALEVEENADLPGAFQLTLGVNEQNDDLTYVDDSFGPLANVAIVAQAENGSQGNQCIFDGYVLTQHLHLQSGLTHSQLVIWGQDVSWQMNLEEKVREWVDVTDSAIAESIFGDYQIQPADANSANDSPSHTEDQHSLMQRGTDIQFLRMLAQRTGKLCRVVCDSTPGSYTGYFARPAFDGSPTLTLTLNRADSLMTEQVDLTWDASRPTAIKASEKVFDSSDADGVSGDTDDSGLTALGARTLSSFAAKPKTAILTTLSDSGGELLQRAQAVLADATLFVQGEAEVDAARVNLILRVGHIVRLNGIGAIHSGDYYVWSVRHTIDRVGHKMKFVLRRNAVGNAPGGSGGGLLGAVGL